MTEVAAGADEILALPAAGRVFTGERTVRLGDATPRGRLRLDAIATFLQDVAEDDAADAGWPSSIGWVLRRCAMTVRRFPRRGEHVSLQTFCSGTGARWAERTTTVAGDTGGLLQARAIWVAVDAATGRPARLGDLFHDVYGPSTAGRSVSSRLTLPAPPAQGERTDRPWPVRATDLDVWEHVNNAVHWQAVEDELARVDWVPAVAELEYNEAIVASDSPSLVSRRSPGRLSVWLVEGDRLLASARVAAG